MRLEWGCNWRCVRTRWPLVVQGKGDGGCGGSALRALLELRKCVDVRKYDTQSFWFCSYFVLCHPAPLAWRGAAARMDWIHPSWLTDSFVPLPLVCGSAGLDSLPCIRSRRSSSTDVLPVQLLGQTGAHLERLLLPRAGGLGRGGRSWLEHEHAREARQQGQCCVAC